jgi:hypothetical protein
MYAHPMFVDFVQGSPNADHSGQDPTPRRRAGSWRDRRLGACDCGWSEEVDEDAVDSASLPATG